MISRRDQLLIRPWQQRRYENHRRKVLAAVPAIDNREPTARNHVLIKLKKHQKELEKCERIERDNFSLLRNLSYIMRTNRVDNSWSRPQPSFLNKVILFENPPQYKEEFPDRVSPPKSASRREKCTACTPQKPNKPKYPEERIPWEPEKQSISRKLRSQSVPTSKSSLLPTINQSQANTKERSSSCKVRFESVKSKTKNIQKGAAQSNKPERVAPQSVIFSRGSLELAVSFPTGTLVKLHDHKSDKLLMGGSCYCRNVAKVC